MLLNSISEDDAILLIEKMREYQKDFPARVLIEKMKEEGVKRFYTPYYISWEVTGACNLRCAHCCFAGQEYKSDKDIDSKRAAELANELVDADILKVMLTGGEPFLRKDIFDIIKILKSRNIIIQITSNGTLITEAVTYNLENLFNPNYDYVQISLDGGYAATHDETRGKGCFDKTIAGIKLLVKHNINVTINCVVTVKNLSEMKTLYKLASDLGVKKVTYTRVFNNDNLLPDDNVLFKETTELLKQETKDVPIELRLFTVPELAACKTFNSSTVTNRILSKHLNFDFICHKWEKLHIRKDGDVFLCLHASNNDMASLGNIKSCSMSEILVKRDENILFKPRKIVNEKCNKCTFVSLCKAGCPVNAYMKYSDINLPDPVCLC